MDKEQAKNILKKVVNPDVKEAIETLIPELTESDDERIRKRISLCLDECVHSDIIRDYERDECLAWLEKQKYDRMKPIYDARESFESALEKAWNDYHNGYENVDKLEDDYVECAHAKGFREGFLFGVEKQKEQKSELPLMNGDTDTYFDDLRMTTKPLTSRQWFDEGIKYAQRLQKKQKPAEDKELLKNILFQKKGITYDDYKRKNNPSVILFFDELIECLEEYDKRRSNKRN